MVVIRQPHRGFGPVGWLVVALAAMGQPATGSEPSLPIVVPISPDGVQRATIILDSYSYSPSHLVVESGKPVELTPSSITIATSHNFIVHERLSALVIEQDVVAGKPPWLDLFPRSPAALCSIATNDYGRCRVIEKREWKGYWKLGDGSLFSN